MKLLHITAHLGGGVGRTISRQAAFTNDDAPPLQRTIVCLEKPEKTGAVDTLKQHNCKVIQTNAIDDLSELVAASDLVQIEWWHHPVLAQWLYSSKLPAMRLIVVSHISGLHPPVLPPSFVRLPHRFVFTSPCSFEHPAIAKLSPIERNNIATVFSSGGFDDLPKPTRQHSGPLRLGYVGTLNFSKLHPDFLAYLAAVAPSRLQLKIFGDPTTAESLQQQARINRLEDLLDFRGYCTDMATEFAELDVLTYLLNPRHYGTTENALLEAMAMGVIPVALANPAERQLISHNQTGFLINSPAEFAQALHFLQENPLERARISEAASRHAREEFSIKRTALGMMKIYRNIINAPKREFEFRSVFGHRPAAWFLSCQGEEAYRFCPSGHVNLQGQPPHLLFERTKSSVTHFCETFPSDPLLRAWKESIQKFR